MLAYFNSVYTVTIRNDQCTYLAQCWNVSPKEKNKHFAIEILTFQVPIALNQYRNIEIS